jgi:phosphomannomutase
MEYASQAKTIDTTDGISMEFDDWRFNLRSSNTEPVVRLNVESRGDLKLMQEKTAEILRMLRETECEVKRVEERPETIRTD